MDKIKISLISLILSSQKNKSNQLKSRPEFPKFSGKDIHEWLYRVEQMMEFYSIKEEDQKVRLAALHLEKGPTMVPMDCY